MLRLAVGCGWARPSVPSACAVARSIATAASPPTHARSWSLLTTSRSFASVWTSSSMGQTGGAGQAVDVPISVESRR